MLTKIKTKIKKIQKGRQTVIIDEIENFNKYTTLHDKFTKVAEFIKENSLTELNTGRHEIDGQDMYVNIDEYVTKDVLESLPEGHRNYIDIQIVLEGHEKIGYTNINNAKSKIEYNSEKDIEFFKADCEYIKAYSGRFFIFYPQDIHHPCITDNEKSQIKKAVFKIKI